ncbi:MAG: mercury(II) reductase [Candidatus Omnitrophica bacterium]|nr:mercury(II) reductase [Candidatus Omnitrophota bacterium]
MKDRFDVVILGGGSAAFAGALKAVELGAEVAICEEGVIGGTCLNRGCIPSKNLLKASEIFYYSHHQPFSGIEIPKGRIDFEKVIEQKDEIVQELRQEKYINILRENKRMHYFEGRASFLSKDEVKVGGEILRGKRFIIATGARPQVVNFNGIDKVDFLNSTTVLDLKRLPDSMIILGGRFVAVEMAQIFAHFGTKVTILQRSPRIIPEEEEEVSEGLSKYLMSEGIDIHTGVKVIEVSQINGMKVIKAAAGGEVMEFKGETILMATGNTPNTESLNLWAVGVEMDERGFIKTDEYMRTSNPAIFAAGDVVGGIQLVTVAAHEGAVAAQNAMEECCARKIDYTAVPHAIFTHPNVASVGLTERQARDKGIKVITRTLNMHYVPKARAIRETKGLIKIIAEEGAERILGVHILAPDAAEIIHQAVLLVKKGMTISDVINKVDVYPTLSEMVKLCAQSFYKEVGRLSCCAE